MKLFWMLHESTAAGLAVVTVSLHVQMSRPMMDCRVVYRVVSVRILDCAVMRAAVRIKSVLIPGKRSRVPRSQSGVLVS